MRRTGDEVAIHGDYQYQALHHGPAVQRFWHRAKQIAIAQLLPPEPGDFVLDVACGSGVISEFLARQGAEVLGIDGNEAAIEFARAQHTTPGLEFRHGLVDEHFDVGRPVDKVYCLELIEHVYYPQAQQLLEIVRSILRPGGRVFFTTPNYRSAWPLIEWVMDRMSSAPELGGAQHVEHFHAAKLRRLMTESGFTVDDIVTKCGPAPWIAPISWGLAEWVQTKELSFHPGFGSILVCTATVTP